jgi:hypothetical protein
MGDIDKQAIEDFKIKKLEKKYKDIFDSKEFIDKTAKLDKELKEIHERLKKFDQELEGYREDKDQRKIKDFRDNNKDNVV